MTPALLPIALISALAVEARTGGGDHPPPTAHVVAEIEAGRISSVVTAELQVWNAWFDLELSGEFMLSEEDLARLRAKAETFFVEHNALLVDGVITSPAVLKVAPPVDYAGLPSVSVHLEYSLAAAPRQVSFRWDTYEETDYFEEPAVPVMIKFKGMVEQATLTPEEPEYVWHTRAVTPRVRPRVEAVAAAPPAHLVLPVASACLLLITLGVWSIANRIGLRRGVRWLALSAGIVAAVLLKDTFNVEVGSSVSAPSQDQASRIFRSLHGNIYRAFAANTEEEIYDLLAVSVGDAVLDDLYGDVYQSLILRGQGGAVCTIERIEVLDQKIEQPAGEQPTAEFGVDCSWRVHGVVSHWGHQHRRMNQYRGKYRVQHDGRSWKIATVEILDHQRVDSDG